MANTRRVWKSVRYGVSKGLDTAYWSFLEHGYAVSSLMDTAYWLSESLIFKISSFKLQNARLLLIFTKFQQLGGGLDHANHVIRLPIEHGISTGTSPQGKKRKQSDGETSLLQKSIKVTIRQKQVVEGEKDKESYADKFAASMIHNHDDDFGDRIETGSHKEHPEVVDDDDDNQEEKKDDEMGSLENMTEKMQTPIPITPRSPMIILSSDKNINQELTVTVSPSTTTSSKDPHKKRHISNKYSHLPGALRKMCRSQGYKIRDKERKFLTRNLKRVVADTIIQERDAFQAEHNVIQVHPTITTSTDTTLLADLQQQLYSKMKRSLQDQANDLALWESAMGSSSKRSVKESTTYVTKKQQHQQQEWDAWEEETVIDEDEVIPKDETPELITEFQNVDKRVLTIFDHARMEAILNDMLNNQFQN
ncbi:hypothetical protein Tco_0586533, partial [Tanacetum coccineum]